jgi:hypothetical protein
MEKNPTGDKARVDLVALIGDVIDSRSYSPQAEMLDHLHRAIEKVNREVTALQPLELTVGDEFQGLYRSLAAALRASLLVTLYLQGALEIRSGIGLGPVDVLSVEQAPRGQSGPAWWMAREAIDEVKGLVKGWPAGTRSRFRCKDGTITALVNAFLVCQDQVVSRMDEIDLRITVGILSGARQKDLASSLRISQSAISTRQRFNGPAALARTLESLAEGAQSR